MHLHNHVKNVHSLQMKDYKLRFATEKPDKPDKSEVAFVNTTDKWDGYALEENISGNMRDMSISKENVESIGGNARKSENIDGNALEEDNEGGNIMEDHRTDDLTEEEDSTDGNAREEDSPRHTSMRNEGACFIYSREKLRNLVHNSSPDGLHFLLAFIDNDFFDESKRWLQTAPEEEQHLNLDKLTKQKIVRNHWRLTTEGKVTT